MKYANFLKVGKKIRLKVILSESEKIAGKYILEESAYRGFSKIEDIDGLEMTAISSSAWHKFKKENCEKPTKTTIHNRRKK